MTLANAGRAAGRGRSEDRAGKFQSSVVGAAAWPRPLARATDWAKERRRRRYLAAVKRRLRRFNPPAAR